MTTTEISKTNPAMSDNPRAHGARSGGSIWALVLGMIAIFLYLLYRNLGLYPVVMADEWAYSLHSRLLPFSKSPIPSYLYFWIFKQTNHCGGSYTDCARLFNSILFVAAGPFIYAVSRRVVQPVVAAFIALLSLLGPINTYTAYFMPEAMYFLGFWVLTWFVMGFRKSAPFFYGGMIGLILAALSMIKVHAMFLAPGVAAAIITSAARSHDHISARFRKVLLTLVFAGIAAIIARFLIGYFFAGTAGLHILGQKYGAVADSSLTVSSLLHLIGQAAFVVRGDILGLALLFAVPLVCLAAWQVENASSSQADDVFVIKIYTIAMLAFLLLVTAYYTASVSGQPHEALGRLHFRYCSFTLPLLLVVAAAEWSTAREMRNLYLTVPIGTVIGGLAIYAVRALRTQYAPNCVDSPEVRAAFFNSKVLHALALLGIAVLALWVFNRRRGAQVFLLVFLPVSVITTARFANIELRDRMHPGAYERAGQAAHSILTKQERAKLVVVGSNDVELYKTIYEVDSAEAKMVILPQGTALDMSAIPAEDDWVLVVGDHAVPRELQLQFPRGDYALFKREGSAP